MSKEITHSEFSKKGGLATKKKYGKKHYQEMQKKGEEAKRKIKN